MRKIGSISPSRETARKQAKLPFDGGGVAVIRETQENLERELRKPFTGKFKAMRQLPVRVGGEIAPGQALYCSMLRTSAHHDFGERERLPRWFRGDLTAILGPAYRNPKNDRIARTITTRPTM